MHKRNEFATITYANGLLRASTKESTHSDKLCGCLSVARVSTCQSTPQKNSRCISSELRHKTFSDVGSSTYHTQRSSQPDINTILFPEYISSMQTTPLYSKKSTLIHNKMFNHKDTIINCVQKRPSIQDFIPVFSTPAPSKTPRYIYKAKRSQSHRYIQHWISSVKTRPDHFERVSATRLLQVVFSSLRKRRLSSRITMPNA